MSNTNNKRSLSVTPENVDYTNIEDFPTKRQRLNFWQEANSRAAENEVLRENYENLKKIFELENRISRMEMEKTMIANLHKEKEIKENTNNSNQVSILPLPKTNAGAVSTTTTTQTGNYDFLGSGSIFFFALRGIAYTLMVALVAKLKSDYSNWQISPNYSNSNNYPSNIPSSGSLVSLSTPFFSSTKSNKDQSLIGSYDPLLYGTNQ